MRRQNVEDWQIAVIGAGTMGLCIAQLFAMYGHKVNLYNRTPANLEKAMVRIRENLNSLYSLGQIPEIKIEETMSNISKSSDLKESVQGVDMIIENVAECEDVKQTFFTQFDKYCEKDVIFASDTSTMNIYDFLKVSHPERMIITHFFNPAYVMPLCELVRGPETSDETTDAVKRLLESVDRKTAILKKVVPGFIINRVTTAIVRECCYLAEQGVAEFEDIDRALVAIYGPRFAFEGPFQLGDFAGIDIFERLATLLSPVLCNDTQCSEMLTEMVAENKLGVKNQTGFYSYEDTGKAHQIRDMKYIKMIAAINEVNRSIDQENTL